MEQTTAPIAWQTLESTSSNFISTLNSTSEPTTPDRASSGKKERFRHVACKFRNQGVNYKILDTYDSLLFITYFRVKTKHLFM